MSSGSQGPDAAGLRAAMDSALARIAALREASAEIRTPSSAWSAGLNPLDGLFASGVLSGDAPAKFAGIGAGTGSLPSEPSEPAREPETEKETEPATAPESESESEPPKKTVTELLAELDALTGLAEVKGEVHRQVAVLRVEKMRTEAGLRSATIRIPLR